MEDMVMAKQKVTDKVAPEVDAPVVETPLITDVPTPTEDVKPVEGDTESSTVSGPVVPVEDVKELPETVSVNRKMFYKLMQACVHGYTNNLTGNAGLSLLGRMLLNKPDASFAECKDAWDKVKEAIKKEG
jgi:hypothetical protein